MKNFKLLIIGLTFFSLLAVLATPVSVFADNQNIEVMHARSDSIGKKSIWSVLFG